MRCSSGRKLGVLCFVVASCGVLVGPEPAGTFVLETVAGRAPPVRVEAWAGHVSLMADTLRLEAGGRYARTSLLLEEDPQAGGISRITVATAGTLVRQGTIRVLVPDACRPDRREFSLCIAPDTLARAGAGLAIRTPILPGDVLVYRPVG